MLNGVGIGGKTPLSSLRGTGRPVLVGWYRGIAFVPCGKMAFFGF